MYFADVHHAATDDRVNMVFIYIAGFSTIAVSDAHGYFFEIQSVGEDEHESNFILPSVAIKF